MSFYGVQGTIYFSSTIKIDERKKKAIIEEQWTATFFPYRTFVNSILFATSRRITREPNNSLNSKHSVQDVGVTGYPFFPFF